MDLDTVKKRMRGVLTTDWRTQPGIAKAAAGDGEEIPDALVRKALLSLVAAKVATSGSVTPEGAKKSVTVYRLTRPPADKRAIAIDDEGKLCEVEKKTEAPAEASTEG